jgi:hypothetical protein
MVCSKDILPYCQSLSIKGAGRIKLSLCLQEECNIVEAGGNLCTIRAERRLANGQGGIIKRLCRSKVT